MGFNLQVDEEEIKNKTHFPHFLFICLVVRDKFL